LFIIPPRVQQRQLLIHDILQSAQQSGVKFVLTVGHLSAATPPSTFLGNMGRDTEDKVRDTGIPHCSLHLELPMDIHFADAENLQWTNAFYYPLAPETQFNPVLNADVGEIAAAILTNWATHVGKAYTLTGPQQISMADIAQIYSGILGRPIKFVPASHRNAILSFQGRGFHEWYAKGIVELQERFRSPDYTSVISGDGPELLGRPMTSFRDFVLANKQHFSSL